MTVLESYSFKGCTSLTSVTIPYSVTGIKQAVFQNCNSLTAISIPNSVTDISISAFENCSSITSITIPNSVKQINSYAFLGCTGLTSVIIGSGILSINSKTFASCSQLVDVYCYSENVPNTGTDAFEGSYIEYVTLHVPDASIDLYKAAEPWKYFNKIVGLNGTETPKCATPTIKIVEGEVTFECETEDVTFKWNYSFNGGNAESDGNKVILAGKTNCHVTVYAAKEGYQDSDVAETDVELYVGKKGDVNADGEVNVGDLVTTTNIMMGKDN